MAVGDQRLQKQLPDRTANQGGPCASSRAAAHTQGIPIYCICWSATVITLTTLYSLRRPPGAHPGVVPQHPRRADYLLPIAATPRSPAACSLLRGELLRLVFLRQRPDQLVEPPIDDVG